MKLRKFGVICRRIIFLLLLIITVLYMCAVFEMKTLDGPWNYTTKIHGFANEPENTFDIIGVGSSHLYCTFTPVHLYEQTGLRSYILSTAQQPPEASYHYIKYALENQKPDVVLIEMYMYIFGEFESEAANHGAIDNYPNVPNKIQMIKDVDPADGKENYYFNFMKYHTRWKELTKADFRLDYTKRTDPYHGYVFLTQSAPNDSKAVTYDDIEELPVIDKYQVWLDRTIELVRENGSEPVLLISPYRITYPHTATAKYLHRYAAEKGVTIIDTNLDYDKIGLDNQKDFYDNEHLNVYGAEKTTLYIGNFLKEKLGVEPKQHDDLALWQEDVEFYNAQKAPLS